LPQATTARFPDARLRAGCRRGVPNKIRAPGSSSHRSLTGGRSRLFGARQLLVGAFSRSSTTTTSASRPSTICHLKVAKEILYNFRHRDDAKCYSFLLHQPDLDCGCSGGPKRYFSFWATIWCPRFQVWKRRTASPTQVSDWHGYTSVAWPTIPVWNCEPRTIRSTFWRGIPVTDDWRVAGS